MAIRDTEGKKKLFLAKYPETKFNISKTTKAVGISRMTFRRWVDNDPDFADRLEELIEETTDEIESNLMQLIQGKTITLTKTTTQSLPDGTTKTTITKSEKHYPPDIRAIKVFLEAKARHRGYGMRLDESDKDDYES